MGGVKAKTKKSLETDFYSNSSISETIDKRGVKVFLLVAVAVRVIKLFGTKDNQFSALGDVSRNDFFLSPL